MGYDAPKTLTEEDRLGRIHFARMVYDLAVNTDRRWSVRIGVHGAWGEGKTSVLNFVREMAARDGHAIIEVNAWRYTDSNRLREALFDELRRLVPRTADKGVLARFFGGRAIRAIGSGAKLLAGGVKANDALAGLADLLESGSPVLAEALKELGVSAEDFRRLQAGLGEKRAIVIVDDIDRAEPDLLARLFFTLREALDLPGFSFLLGFDRARVIPVLREAHPGFDTEEFLDKIIEFPLHLPALTREQRLALARDDLAQHDLPLSQESIEATLDLFPESPRRLRLFLRKLKALAAEIRRHDVDELNPLLLLQVHLLMEYAPQFAGRLFDDVDMQKKVMKAGRLFRNLRSAKDAEPEAEVRRFLHESLSENGIDPRELDDRVDVLMKILTAMGNNIKAYDPRALAYYANVGTRPHAVTNREFRLAFEGWGASRTAPTVRAWADEQARRRTTTTVAVLREMVHAANLHREGLMGRAVEAGSTSEQVVLVERARDALRCVRLLAFDLGGVAPGGWLSVEDVLAFRVHVAPFAHFRGRPYQALREEEDAVLEQLLTAEHLDAAVVYADLQPPGFRPRRAGEHAGEEVRHRILTVLRERLADQAVAAFEKADGLQVLARTWNQQLFDELVFAKQSPVWSAPRRGRVLDVVARAATDDAVFENVYSFLSVVTDRGAHGGTMLSDKDAARRMWAAVTSRRMNRRWLGSLDTEVRPSLEAALRSIEGQSYEALLLPDWWAGALVDPQAPGTPKVSQPGGSTAGDDGDVEENNHDIETDPTEGGT